MAASEARRDPQAEARSEFDARVHLFCVSAEGRQLAVSPSACDLLGYSQAELLSRPLRTLVHPDDRAVADAHLRQLGDGLDVLPFEIRLSHQDGSYRWLRWTASGLPAEQLLYAHEPEPATSTANASPRGLAVAGPRPWLAAPAAALKEWLSDPAPAAILLLSWAIIVFVLGWGVI